mgnify:CR=1 FL=1
MCLGDDRLFGVIVDEYSGSDDSLFAAVEVLLRVTCPDEVNILVQETSH